jgi:hypothetical protein
MNSRKPFKTQTRRGGRHDCALEASTQCIHVQYSPCFLILIPYPEQRHLISFYSGLCDYVVDNDICLAIVMSGGKRKADPKRRRMLLDYLSKTGGVLCYRVSYCFTPLG